MYTDSTTIYRPQLKECLRHSDVSQVTSRNIDFPSTISKLYSGPGILKVPKRISQTADWTCVYKSNGGRDELLFPFSADTMTVLIFTRHYDISTRWLTYCPHEWSNVSGQIDYSTSWVSAVYPAVMKSSISLISLQCLPFPLNNYIIFLLTLTPSFSLTTQINCL